MRLAIIKHNAGNIRSVAFALDRLGVSYSITDSSEEIRTADKVIFPGVGEASSTMRYLRESKLDKVIEELRQPVLGICLGMQLLCRHSDENETECIGIFDETVSRFPSNDLKVPHVGWNSIKKVSDWLAHDLEDQYVYFVHSYYVPVSPYTVAQCEYGVAFSAAMKKGNFHTVQFHPEKSAAAGVKILKNFLEL